MKKTITTPTKTNKDIILIGKEIKKIKTEKKISYYKLSKLSGLTHSQIQNIENGNKAYTFESLLKVCNGLEIDLGSLITNLLKNKKSS